MIKNYKNLIQALKQSVDDLNRQNISVKSNTINFNNFMEISSYDRELAYTDMAESSNLVLPEMFKEIIFPQTIHLNWSFIVSEKQHNGGEFNLFFTPAVFVNTLNTDFVYKLSNFEKKLYKEGFRFIDSHPNAGDAIIFAIKITDRTISSNIWQIDLKTQLKMPLNIDYFEYVNHSIILKGLYDWQLLFMDYNYDGFERDLLNLKFRLDSFASLFPKIDISYYQKIFTKIKKS
jgi:hypothetical protein